MHGNKVLLLIYYFPHLNIGITYFKYITLEIQGVVTDERKLTEFLAEKLEESENRPVFLQDVFVVA